MYSNHFLANIMLFPTSLGGRKIGIKSDYRPNFNIKGSLHSGNITFKVDNLNLNEPLSDAEIKLIFPAEVEKNTQFLIKEGTKIVGVGIITKVYH